MQPQHPFADQQQDAHQQHRREDGAYALDHLGRIQAQPQGHAEVDQAEQQHRPLSGRPRITTSRRTGRRGLRGIASAPARQKRQHRQLEGRGPRARNGKEGPHRQVDDGQKGQREPRVDAVQRRPVAVVVVGTDDDGQQRQPHPRQHEPQQRLPQPRATLHAQCRREDEVAGAKEDGKQHETDDEGVPVHGSAFLTNAIDRRWTSVIQHA